MGKIIRYQHHGTMVSVDEKLKGRHRKYCLCWKCRSFNLDEDVPEPNCEIAEDVFEVCKIYNLVTPVWECPFFREKK